MMAAMHRRHQQRKQENPVKAELHTAVAKHKENRLNALLTFETALLKGEEAEASVGPEFGHQLGEKIFDGLLDDLKDFVDEAADIGKTTLSAASSVYGAAKGAIEGEIARGEKLTAAQAAIKVVSAARKAVEKECHQLDDIVDNLTDEQIEAIQDLVDTNGEEGAFRAMGLPPPRFVDMDSQAKALEVEYKTLVHDAKPMAERGDEIEDHKKIVAESNRDVEGAEKELGSK